MDGKILVFLSAIIIMFFYIYGEYKFNDGIEYCEDKQKAAQKIQLDKDEKTIKTLEKKHETRTSKIQNQKKVISNIQDKTGCDNIPEPIAISNCMRYYFDSGTFPRPNGKC